MHLGPLEFCCKEILLYLAQVTGVNPSSGWSPFITDIRPASVSGITFLLDIATTCVARVLVIPDTISTLVFCAHVLADMDAAIWRCIIVHVS